MAVRTRLALPSVEYSLVDHCNLRCYACDHASPLLPISFTDVRTFEADLRALARVALVDQLYLIGGEPMLHPQLLDFVSIGCDSGLARGVTLVTNGTLLHTAPDALWTLLSGLDVTTYPGVPLRMPPIDIVTKAACHNVRLRLRNRVDFRVTLLNDPIVDSTLVQTIFDACRIAHDYHCHSVLNGRYYKCSPAPHLAKRLALLSSSRPYAAAESDGVSLHDNPRLRAELEAYLRSGRPLGACAYCLGTSGRTVPHHQTNAAERLHWMTERHDDVTSLLDNDKLHPVRQAHPFAPTNARRAGERLWQWLQRALGQSEAHPGSSRTLHGPSSSSP